MSNSRTLYEQLILDHNKNPHNYGKPATADAVVEAFNPLCGDTFQLYINFDGDVIDALHFDGNGCAISKSSTSLMTTMLKGKTKSEARELFRAFQAMLNSDPDAPIEKSMLGELMAFSGVREYPMRIKCAVLAWRALDSVLNTE